MANYYERERERRHDRLAEWRQLADEGFCFTCLHKTDGSRRVRHRVLNYHNPAV